MEKKRQKRIKPDENGLGYFKGNQVKIKCFVILCIKLGNKNFVLRREFDWKT